MNTYNTTKIISDIKDIQTDPRYLEKHIRNCYGEIGEQFKLYTGRAVFISLVIYILKGILLIATLTLFRMNDILTIPSDFAKVPDLAYIGLGVMMVAIGQAFKRGALIIVKLVNSADRTNIKAYISPAIYLGISAYLGYVVLDDYGYIGTCMLIGSLIIDTVILIRREATETLYKIVEELEKKQKEFRLTTEVIENLQQDNVYKDNINGINIIFMFSMGST